MRAIMAILESVDTWRTLSDTSYVMQKPVGNSIPTKLDLLHLERKVKIWCLPTRLLQAHEWYIGKLRSKGTFLLYKSVSITFVISNEITVQHVEFHNEVLNLKLFGKFPRWKFLFHVLRSSTTILRLDNIRDLRRVSQMHIQHEKISFWITKTVRRKMSLSLNSTDLDIQGVQKYGPFDTLITSAIGLCLI